jgi:hypothetical protein
MSSSKITKKELEEIKAYTKKQFIKLRKEGSTTAGVPGYLTPAAFTGDEDGDGTDAIDLEDDQYAYSIKASTKKPHFIKLHEISYKNFKEDANTNEIQKVNNKILEVSRMLREISRSLDHSIKLKQESKLDNTKYWKRTNEAILKISRRLAEVNKKARKLANLKELATTSMKDNLEDAFKSANITIEDISSTNKNNSYEFNFSIADEASSEKKSYAIDIDEKGNLEYNGMGGYVSLGNFNAKDALTAKIRTEFKAQKT